MEATVSFLEDDHIRGKLEVFVDFLQQLDDHFACVVAPFLSFFWLISSILESFENKVVDLLFDG